MKTFYVFIVVLVCLLVALLSFGQSSSYYHDPSLDSINRSLITLDSDLNAKPVGGGSNGASMTIGDLAVFGASTMQGGPGGTFTNQLGQKVSFTNNPSVVSSNLFGAASSNAQALVQAWFNTEMISGLSNSFYTSTWTNGIGDGAGVAGSVSVPQAGGPTYVMDFSLNHLYQMVSSAPAMGVACRRIILDLYALILFVWCLNFLKSNIKQIMYTNQMRGLSQEVLGSNAVVPTGVLFCIIVAAGLSVTVGYFGSSFAGGFLGSGAGSGVYSVNGSAFSVTSDVSAFASVVPAWDILTYFCPVIEIILMYLNYLAFEFLYGKPVFLLVQSIKMFLFS